MFNCPNCGERFNYGWPCLHEFTLFLLTQGRWKCANCGSMVISDHQVVQLNNDEMEEAAKQMYGGNDSANL